MSIEIFLIAPCMLLLSMIPRKSLFTSACHNRALTFIAFFFTITNISLKNVGRLAQLVEHQSYKLGVTGSSPVPPTKSLKLFLGSSVGRANDC